MASDGDTTRSDPDQTRPSGGDKTRPSNSTDATIGRPSSGEVSISGTPARIGQFEIIRLLGAGGMGMVYEARQTRPQRNVALKVIKPGFVTDTLLRRFEREADVLGRLQHPGVAQVYEVGTAGEGDARQPYFAMELVRGRTLTDYARSKNLDLRGRLELIVRVCDAVQYAHQQGVIHRDLKPANILVDDTGQPKILDFGIAKITSADNPTATLETQAGQIIGTLAYMSPEQARGETQTLDTRADIYALGVIAYELMAGRMPYDLAQAVIVEAIRVICEEEPAALSSVHRTLRGDVETIIGKAMSKERDRRYASASEFAGDLRRFLADEPIAARPPSAWYQASKFARRNKALVIGGAAVFAVLVLGVIGTSVGLVRAEIARAAAQREEARARAAEKDAVVQRGRAEEQAEAAQRTLYYQAIALASRETPGNVAATAALLDRCPERFRDWEWRYLRLRADQSDTVIEPEVSPGAKDRARAIEWSPDGERLMVLDGRLRIVDARSKRTLTRIDTRTAFARWSPDGRFVATIDAVGSLHLWSPDDGKEVRSWSVGDTQATDMAWSPDSRQIVTADVTPTLRVWNADDGKKAREWTIVAPSKTAYANPWGATCVRWSPDGKRLAYHGGDGAIHLRPLAEDESERVLTPRYKVDGLVRRIDWTPDGNRLVTTNVTYLDVIKLETPDTRNMLAPTFGMPANRAAYLTAQWNPRGPGMAASCDRVLRVWRDDPVVNLRALDLLGHEETIYAMAWRRDGQRLATVDSSGTVRCWSIDPAHITEFPIASDLVVAEWTACSPDGRFLAIDAIRKTFGIDIVELATGRTILHVEQGADRADRASAATWSPDGKTLALVTPRKLDLLDTATGKTAEGLRFDADDSTAAGFDGASWSGDGRRIVLHTRTKSSNNENVPRAQVYDTAAKKLHAIADTPQHIWCAAWASDHRRLAIGAGFSGALLIYDAESRRSLLNIVAHEGNVRAVAWSADGKRVLTGGEDRRVCLWDAATGNLLASYGGAEFPVVSVGFNPRGTRVLAATSDDVRLWDTESKQLLLAIPSPAVRSATWTADGRRIVLRTGTPTQFVRVLNALPSP